MIQESNVNFLSLEEKIDDKEIDFAEIEFDEDAGKRWNTDTPINNYDSVQYIYEEPTSEVSPYLTQYFPVIGVVGFFIFYCCYKFVKRYFEMQK